MFLLDAFCILPIDRIWWTSSSSTTATHPFQSPSLSLSHPCSVSTAAVSEICPENWPLGEQRAILVLLGSWLIIGVSVRGKINQGESWGMFWGALLHICPDGWNYTCLFLVALLPNWLSTFFSPSLTLPSFMCQWSAKRIRH